MEFDCLKESRKHIDFQVCQGTQLERIVVLQGDLHILVKSKLPEILY